MGGRDAHCSGPLQDFIHIELQPPGGKSKEKIWHTLRTFEGKKFQQWTIFKFTWLRTSQGRRGKERREMSRGPFKRRVCLGKGETTATKESKQTLAEGLGWYWGARDGCGVLMQRHWDLYLQIWYLDEKWLCYHREFLQLFTRSVFLAALKYGQTGADDSQHKSTEGS